MAKKRHSVNISSSFVKVLASFLLSLSLFASSSFCSSAAVGADGDINLSLAAWRSTLNLDFFGNYTVNGSDSDVSIPYSFRGSAPLKLSLSLNDSKYRYVTGLVTYSVTYTLATQVTGLQLTNSPPSVFIEDSSLPDGVSVAITSISGSSSSFNVLLNFSFSNVDMSYIQVGGLTLGFSHTGVAKASQFGQSYSRLSYTTSVASDWSGSFKYSENVTDMDPGAKYFYNMMEKTDQNIVSQTDSIMDNASKLSDAEIAAADKNAQDIMHSYDSSSQQADNERFESSRMELQEQEDSLFSSAMDGFGSLDLEDYSIGRFTAMASAFSFVSGFMQSLYVKMGDFGAIVTIGLVVMIASKVIGLYRFSTGGDSS